MIRHRWIPAAALAACVALIAGGDVPLAAGAAKSAGKAHKASVPLEHVPQVVTDAAQAAVEGLTLTEAKVRTKKAGLVFKLGGTAGSRGYEIKVDAAGKVLEVEEEIGPAARGNGAAKAKKEARALAEVEAVGPVGETFAGSPAVRVGRILHPRIRESSGVVASRAEPGVFWTHNDKGNAPVLYAVARDGTSLAEFHVGAAHDDWEDVATDDCGNLYVGNIGNNDADRDWVEVHRLREPSPRKAADDPAPGVAPSRSLAVARTWRLRFPEAPFDCEALFVHGTHGYLISKHHDGAPASLYRFRLDGDDDVTLQRVAGLPTHGPVTAADLSADGATLAVLTYGELYTFAVGGDPARVSDVEPRRVATPPGKLEGVCFTPDGIVITSEGRDVFLTPSP